MRIPRHPAKKARIEIIPMIDVIFFLLVFFMVATLSMTVYRGVPVNLPKAATGREAVPESAALTVTRDGQIYVNKHLAALDQVSGLLKSLLAENPNLVVILNADEEVRHGRVIDVMDEVRGAGAARLAIAVKPRGGKR